MPKYLILKGAYNIGKTSTINDCWNSLVAEGATTITRQQDTKDDFYGMLEYQKKMIGFFSWGDDDHCYTEPIGNINRREEWESLRKKCQIIICATRTSGCALDYLIEYFKRNNLEELFWISKFHDTSDVAVSARRTTKHLRALIDVTFYRTIAQIASPPRPLFSSTPPSYAPADATVQTAGAHPNHGEPGKGRATTKLLDYFINQLFYNHNKKYFTGSWICKVQLAYAHTLFPQISAVY